VIIAFFANLLHLLLLPIRAIRSARAAPPGGYVSLVIDGPIADLPRPASLLAALRRTARATLSVGHLKQIAKALAADARPAGLLIEVRSPAGGQAVLSSIRDVLLEVRASGKDVIAYLPLGADTAALFLASAARLVIVGPETTLAPIGFAARGRYVRRALERIGVEPEVFARGAYKSAGENLVRDAMSDPQREQLGAILDAFHDALVTALAQSRRVPRETAARWIDEAPHSAARAVELGIIDAIAYEDELPRAIARGSAAPAGPTPTAGALPDVPPRLRLVPSARYLRARTAGGFRPATPRPSLGVIEVHGPIVSRPRLSLAPLAAEDALIAAIRQARADRRIYGVILHIDSPGGSALASDRIHHEVTRLAEAKPVVAYLSNVAASGGYYIAVAAQTIIAQPQTITGSIGVVSTRLAVGPLLERLGVFTSVVKRGARADLFSPTRRLEDAERTVIERELDAFYQTFLGVVARGRRRPLAEIAPLAEGRIYSGTEAQARGLIDHLGGFDRALHELRELLGPEGKGLHAHIIRPPRVVPPPPALLTSVAAALEILGEIMGLAPLLETATLALHTRGERVLAFCPDLDSP
jgi:protease IV